jgi:hypothetical protein
VHKYITFFTLTFLMIIYILQSKGGFYGSKDHQNAVLEVWIHLGATGGEREDVSEM